MAALKAYSYPVDLSTYRNACRYPGFFETRIEGDRASTMAFEDRYRSLIRDDVAATLEVVYWKMYSQGRRDHPTDRVSDHFHEQDIKPRDIADAVYAFTETRSRDQLHEIRTLLGFRSKVLPIALTLPALIRPELLPMVDSQVANWVNDNLELHNRNRDSRLTPFKMNYTSLQDNDFDNYLNWVAWCREMARVLGERTEMIWRPRDVEMAVFTARRTKLPLNVIL